MMSLYTTPNMFISKSPAMEHTLHFSFKSIQHNRIHDHDLFVKTNDTCLNIRLQIVV